MEQMTSICDMVGQYMEKKEEDRRIAEDQAAKDRYWKIPICYDDDEDYTIAIIWYQSQGNKIERTSRGFPEESKDTSLLQSLRICMRHSIMGPVTGDRKLSGQCMQPSVERFMLEIYQNATGATYTIMDRVLKSARDVKE
ncbi:hypothetical protein Tco_0002072 [Tanacetum coccineum]